MRFILSALFSLFAVQALACTPLSAPTVISAPGNYCLGATVTVGSGVVPFTINSPNVSFDLKGYSIAGPGSGTGVGIYVPSGKYNVKIYNGSISGFMYGIRAINANGVSLTGIDASYNTFRGVAITGSNARVEHSRIDFLNGHVPYADSYTMAVEILGPNCIVRFNTIKNTMPRGVGEGVGISLSSNNSGCQVYDNLVRLNDADPAHGRTFGVWVGETPTGVSVHNNVILGTDYAVAAWASTIYPNNYIDTACGVFRSTQTDADCIDNRSYLNAQIQLEPNQPNWLHRMGFTYWDQFDEINALIYWDQACSMGQAESCRVAARARDS